MLQVIGLERFKGMQQIHFVPPASEWISFISKGTQALHPDFLR
jgi:hypothetical protein